MKEVIEAKKWVDYTNEVLSMMEREKSGTLSHTRCKNLLLSMAAGYDDLTAKLKDMTIKTEEMARMMRAKKR